MICKKNYFNIDGKCYYKQHINILQTLIDSNISLKGISPLQIGNEVGYQNWVDGKLTHLSLVNNNLTKLPESICYIYKDLNAFDVSNNYICPPYPECFEFIGFQNTKACTYSEIDSVKIINKQQPVLNVQSDVVNYQNDIQNKNTSNLNIWETSCSNGYVKYNNNCWRR